MAAIRIAIPIKTLDVLRRQARERFISSKIHQQTVYKLVPPYEYTYGASSIAGTNCPIQTIEYVFVSAVTLHTPFSTIPGSGSRQDETYVFPSNKDGSWASDVANDGLELPGSRKGTLSHREVLADMGYTIQATSVGLIEDLAQEEDS